MSADGLTLALTKGRILNETLPLLAEVGIVPAEDIASSRKLRFATNQAHINLLVLRGADVTTYVRHGIADVGIAGKDMLLEYGSDGIYELLDLGIAKCRLMTSSLPVRDEVTRGGRITVATKFINIARRFYAERGVNADFVKLYGALELAPLVGMADEIVDIVDTGKTLQANGLVERALIAPVSSRLIANRAAMKVKYSTIQTLQQRLAPLLEAGAASE